MQKLSNYILALITPILSWGLFTIIYYAAFSGKVEIYNRLPKYGTLILLGSVLFIAIYGAAICVQIYRQNKMNTKIIACFLVPFLLNVAMIFMFLFMVVNSFL